MCYTYLWVEALWASKWASVGRKTDGWTDGRLSTCWESAVFGATMPPTSLFTPDTSRLAQRLNYSSRDAVHPLRYWALYGQEGPPPLLVAFSYLRHRPPQAPETGSTVTLEALPSPAYSLIWGSAALTEGYYNSRAACLCSLHQRWEVTKWKFYLALYLGRFLRYLDLSISLICFLLLTLVKHACYFIV